MNSNYKGAFLQFDITPNVSPENPAYLQGMRGDLRKSTAVAIPLSMEMCMLEDDRNTRLVLVTADIFGFDRSVVELVRQHASLLGIGPEAIVLTASHTHYAPGTMAGMHDGIGPYYENFTRQLVDIIVSGLGILYERLEPCSISAGRAVAQIGLNRRIERDQAVLYGPHPNGVYVKDTPILRLFLNSSRKTILWVNHGCHPSGMGPDTRISSDYPGIMKQTLVHDNLADGVMFFQGAAGTCKGSINRNGSPAFSACMTDVRKNGQRLAAAVKDAVGQELRPITGSFACAQRQIDLPIKSDADFKTGTLTAEIQMIGLGNGLRLLSLPMEPAAEMAEQIAGLEGISSSDFMLGYTNGLVGFLSTDKMIENRGLETGASYDFYQVLPVVVSGSEERVIGAVHDLLTAVNDADESSGYSFNEKAKINEPIVQNQSHAKSKTRAVNKLPKRRPKLLFLEHLHQSTGGFLDVIIGALKTDYQVKYLKTVDIREAQLAIQWADLVWLEWANQLTAQAINQIPQIRHKKVVCRIHGYEVFTDMPGKINWDHVHRLIFVAKHKQDIFQRKFGRKKVSQTVIRNGVDIDRFSIPTNKKNTKKLVLLGYLNFRKGLPILLHFYQQLLKRDPTFTLYIRGEFQDPRLEMAARTMIREMNLADKLEFVDWVDDLNTWFADKSHILSFSLEESFHYAIGDGMAAGLKPVIHAWTESRDIWPNDYIFRDLDEFLALTLDPIVTPDEYRKTIIDFNLDAKTQLKRIEKVISEVLSEQ